MAVALWQKFNMSMKEKMEKWKEDLRVISLPKGLISEMSKLCLCTSNSSFLNVSSTRPAFPTPTTAYVQLPFLSLLVVSVVVWETF